MCFRVDEEKETGRLLYDIVVNLSHFFHFLSETALIGFSPDHIFTGWGASFGASIFVLLLSLGVADSINSIRRERERALDALQISEGRLRDQYDQIEKQYMQLESLSIVLNLAHDELIDANEKATQEKEVISAILSSIADSVIGCDRDGNVLLLNRIAEELTGYTQEEALGRNINEIIRIDNPRVLDTAFSKHRFDGRN